MKELRVYLWKEWREQRALLGALGLGLCVATFLIGALLDWRTIDPDFTYEWVVSLCVCAALLTVGCDLFARERQSRQLPFLERIPAGLVAAFRGKLVFFVGLLIGAVFYGALLASLLELVHTGVVSAPNWEPSRAPGVALLVLAALWIFAVSTWAPTGVMTLPVAALSLAVFLLPAWLLQRETGRYFPPQEVFWPLALGAAVSALVCARICFVNASARSLPRRVSAGIGLGLGVLCFLPYNVWAGAKYVAHSNRPFSIRDVIVGAGERFVFVNLRRVNSDGRSKGGSSALVIDQRDALWRFAGERDHSAFGADIDELPSPDSEGPHEVVLYDANTRPAGRAYSAMTGRAIDSPAARTSESESTHFKPSDFGLRQFWSSPTFNWSGVGQRVFVWGPDIENKSDDVIAFRTPDGSRHLHLTRENVSTIRVLKQDFLIWDQNTWKWIDPVSYESRPFDLLAQGEKLGPTIEDGTLIVIGESKLSVLDPSDGHREPIQIAPSGALSGTIYDLRRGSRGAGEAPLPRDGSVVMLLEIRKHPHFRHRNVPVLYDAQHRTITLSDWDVGITGPVSVAWTEGPRAIAVEDHARIVHYDFESSERRVLLDVADLSD